MSNELDSLTNQLHSAWWACPGGRKGCFTDDKLDKVFEQYLLQVCHELLSGLETTTIVNVVSTEHDRNRTIRQSQDQPIAR